MSREKYRIRRTLERGPFADVVEASVGEGAFERRVVLKRLRAEYADDPAIRDAFIQEAQLVAALNHPNIVSILDFGSLDDRPFLALEYVDGIDLGSVGSQKIMPFAVALHVTIEVLRALAHANAGMKPDGQPIAVTHRDVTPFNIWLSWDGDVKITGFKLAPTDRPTSSTTVGLRRGTLAFMAPEHAFERTIDHRTDLYAVGCLLHWMLVGVSPLDRPGAKNRHFAGEQLELADAILPEVAAVIRCATSFEPSGRYKTADAMADALWPILQNLAAGDVRRATRTWLETVKDTDPGFGAGLDYTDKTSLYEGLDLASASIVTDRAPSPSHVVTSGDSAVGVVIHGYRIEALIARGGWGDVYAARHLTLNYTYAVKVLGLAGTTPTGTKRLAREAMAMSRLEHPNVVEILDYGVLPNGLPFLTMPLLEGQTLHAIIATEGPLDVERAANLARQIADGLAAAHDAGIVHRDLKPGNVVIVTEGGIERAKILDFGIARSVDDALGQTQLTAPDRLLGTPWYVAPEQIMSPSSVTGAADVYSLGTVLYRMLRVDPPFDGTASEVLRAHLETPPPLLLEAGELGSLVTRMLAKKPEDRPSAAEVVAAIETIGFGGDREATRAVAPLPADTTRLVPTNITHPKAPVYATVDAPQSRTGAWPLVAAAVGLAAVSAALTAAVLLDDDDPPVIATRPTKVVVEARPTLAPRLVERTKVAEVPERTTPRPRRPKNKKPPRATFERDAQKILRSLGLSSHDVNANRILADARSRVAAAGTDASSGHAAVDALRATAEKIAADPMAVRSKLDRIQRLLEVAAGSVEEATMREFEDRYFLLKRTALDSDDQRRRVMRQAYTLERDLRGVISR